MKKIVYLLLLSAGFIVHDCINGQTGQSFAPDSGTTALVLIDIQEFYFPGGKLPLTGSEDASSRAGELLNHFLQNQWPVIHIVHRGGGKPHSHVEPLSGEKIIEKEEVNCFKNTELLPYLKSLEVQNLVLAGMQTHMCLEAATRAASDLGFRCVVIHDACATRDLSFNGQTVKAADVHASTLATLKAYSRILGTREYLQKKQADE